MKKLSLLILLIGSMISISTAQEVKIKKGIVYVDGQEEASIEESGTKFTLKTVDGEEDLAFFSLIDPTPDVNPEFNDNYFLIRFPDHDKEVKFKDFRKLTAIKFIYTHKVVEQGKVNMKNLNSFMETYGDK